MVSHSAARALSAMVWKMPGTRRADLAGPAAARRVHPDEAHVAAQRDRLDPVLGLAAAARPQRAAEADEVLGGLDAEPLAGHQVPDLVQRDRGHHQGEEGDGAAEVDQGVHLLRVLLLRDEFSGADPRPGVGGQHPVHGQLVAGHQHRAYVSAGSRPIGSDQDRMLVEHPLDGVDDVEEPDLARRGRPPRTPRWPRCRPPGALPPNRPARRASSTAGNASLSSGSKVQLEAVDQSQAGATAGQPLRPAERRARSAAACPAASTGPGSSRRRTAPSSARSTADARPRRSGPGRRRRAGGPPAAPGPC